MSDQQFCPAHSAFDESPEVKEAAALSLAGKRLDRAAAEALYYGASPAHAGPAGPRHAPAPASRAHRHLCGRPQHQLFQRLRLRLPLLRLLPRARIRRRLRHHPRGDGPEDRRDPAPGRHLILLQGGHHPDLPLEWYEDLLRWMRATWPGLHIHAFSPPEIFFWSQKFGLSVDEVISRLRAAGLDSIPRRRRRDPPERGPRPGLAQQVQRRPVALRHGTRPQTGHAHHRHHDVRP